MGWWVERVVPRMTERFLSGDQIEAMRADACRQLRGEVLEIGFGSGLNVRHYPSTVVSVAAVEPSDLAWQMAAPRIEASPVPVSRAGLDGQRLDLPDASVDTVLSTFTMCTIPDLDLALAEVARVLRPGGRLVFVEHGRSREPDVARWQQRLNGVHARFAGGCQIRRPVDEHLRSSPLHVDALDAGYAQGLKVLSYRFIGTATKV